MSLYKSIPHTFRKEGIYYFNRRVPNPNKIIQESLFGNIIKEKNYVHGSRKLIKIYTQKIQDKIPAQMYKTSFWEYLNRPFFHRLLGLSP